MKRILTVGLLGLFSGCLAAAHARLQFLPDAKPQCIFGGNGQKISIVLSNADHEYFSGDVRARILQATSATTISHGVFPWKKLQILPGQTVIESARLDFPAVKAETEFLVQWLDDANHIIGVTSVRIYPTNLFQTLRPFLCETNFGVLDPGNQLKPLLKAQKISFADLGEMNLENFSGRLAIIGPFESSVEMPRGLANRIKDIAKRNVAVVWIQPPQPLSPSSPLDWEREKIQPSFYSVQKSQTAVVVVQPDLISNLQENPQSQIALIYFCNLALNPQQAILPGLTSGFDP